MTSQVNNIANNYSQNLATYAEINKRLKFQAKDYYERYKELKTQFKKDRLDLKSKNKLLEYETMVNVAENNKIQLVLDGVKNEMSLFKKKVGLKDEAENVDEDVKIMAEILNFAKREVDIHDGLNDTQKASLNEILENFKDEQEEVDGDNKNQIVLSEGEDDADKIVNEIEEVVNDNFRKGKISNIEINQINDYVYEFNKKEANLFMEADVLMSNCYFNIK